VGIFKIQYNSWILKAFKIHKIRILSLWLEWLQILLTAHYLTHLITGSSSYFIPNPNPNTNPNPSYTFFRPTVT